MNMKKITILYYNTNNKSRDTVLNAAIPIDINVTFTHSFQELYETIVSLDEIDIVFIDYEGEEELLKIISAIHKYDEDLVIYVLSSILDDDEQIKIYSSGATEYLNIPINCHVLQARLKNMAGLRDSRRLLYSKTNVLQEEVDKAVSIIKERELESLLLLGRASEYKDRDTGSHILRVGRYSALIMEKLGGSQEDQELMLYSAPLHDVGKIGIPDSILNKESKLTDEEYVIMKTHTIKGYAILSGTKSKYLDAGAIIALSHHERYDGTGYPKGLKASEIPLYGRIVAIADVFDALMSERVYKNSWTLEQTMDYIKTQAGIHFDPKLTNIFLDNIDEALNIIKTLPPKL